MQLWQLCLLVISFNYFQICFATGWGIFQIRNTFFKLFDVFDSSSNNVFNPKSPYESLFIGHFSYFQFDRIKIDSEFPSAEALFADKNDICSNTIAQFLKDYPQAFDETLKTISILLTIPTSTASNERFFSFLKRVKTYLWTTLGNKW